MAQLQILYSSWLDQDIVGWIQVSLCPQSLAWLIGFDGNHSLLFIVNIAAIMLRPDIYNIMVITFALSMEGQQFKPYT